MSKLQQEARYYQEAWVSNDEVIVKQLRYAGLDPDDLSQKELSRYDQIDHVGGIKNTRLMAEKIDWGKNARVIDVGGGLGGAARYLAQTHGCRVHVVDLIEARCRGGLRLSEMTALSGSVSFTAADAQRLPFPNERIDVVWGQDAFDSIEDKDAFFSECRRVLKPGGTLIFTDHLQGPRPARPDGIYLWPEDIYRRTFAQYRRLLHDNGFALAEEQNLSDWAAMSLQRIYEGVLNGQGGPIRGAQGNEYYDKLLAFLNSFLGYLKCGAVQYGAFRARRE